MPERILVVEDEKDIARILVRNLRDAGYSVVAVDTGEKALAKVFEELPSLILLDLMLPDMDGLVVTHEIRKEGLKIPIIMLTARDAIPDRVTGLDAGADAYLVKPFNTEELLAHVRALIRRSLGKDPDEPFVFADLRLEPLSRLAYRGKRAINLTAKEFELLELFMRHPNQVLSRELIFSRIWEFDFGGESNIIEVYMRYLRSKLEKNKEPRLLHTVRGMGYVLREKP